MNAYPMFEHCYFHQRDRGSCYGTCACGGMVPMCWLPISMEWTGYCEECRRTYRGHPTEVVCPQCPQEVSSGLVADAR